MVKITLDKSLVSGGIFSAKEVEALEKILQILNSRNSSKEEFQNDKLFKNLEAHVKKQIDSRRIFPSIGTVGANFYTSNRRLNDWQESVRRANNRLRGLTTTESLMREPGLYTGNDFDYLREQEEKEQKARREDNEKHTKLREHIAKIRFPEQYRQQSLRSMFGDMGMQMILAAEKDAKGIKAKSRFEDAMYDLGLSDNRREFKNLQEQFGGGEEGHKRAEQYIAKRREREARREELLYKKQHPLLSKISKNMPKIDKSLAGLGKVLGKVPGSGLLGKLGGGNPALGFGIMAYAALRSEAKNSIEASKAVTSWENMRSVYGKPSDAFTRAAFLSGVKDPGEITKLFGHANLEYGDAEQFYRTIGLSLLGTKDPRARAAILQSMQWNETQGNLAMMLAGGRTSTARRSAAADAMNEASDALAYEAQKSGPTKQGFLGMFQLLFSKIGVHKVGAVDAGMYDYAFEGFENDFKFLQDKVMEDTQSAAESADEYESSKQTNISNGDINVTVNIDSVQDGYDLASRIEAGLGSSALRDAYEQRKNGMRA